MENVRDGLQQIASGSISGAYNGLITLGKGAKEVDGKLGETFGKVSETLEDVPVVGWIVSIIAVSYTHLQFVTGISSGKIFVTLRNLSVFLLLDRHPGKQGSCLLYTSMRTPIRHSLPPRNHTLRRNSRCV